ncbi:conserved hypothetical protein [Beutenbergia cavernae DSM 12333]|uniref:Glycoside hydrolase family 42 N-terminal domain-containing protein n=1 Tax=Beutenbergia cavernae (strain ATCC BAA-8 / DSM 12333 / CCUG 43141 / JCM 11478 / NBRC 16432 / NCIMB 13614 / HKI 0122) TaxID=471853 RepID=C5BVH7_BEUC1|nr:hypothetical protein [Beutenbergia cavernae]ACQ78417.1 conserved hypothetical protein [Beutenbergia cavernae DSM 12333]
MHEAEPGSTLARLTRRNLLRATAAAAVATGIGVSGMGAAAARAGATRTPRERPAPAATSDLPLVGGEEFPIGLFWPPPPFETNVERYTEIKDAGFTFLITGNYLFDAHIVRHALGVADEVGLKVLVSDDLAVKIAAQRFTIDDAGGRLTLTREEAGAFIREAHGNYAAHPSFAGLNFFDEPFPERYPTLGAAFDLYRETSGAHLPYANLLPNIFGDGYDDYLNGFVEQVRPSVVSFDRYPLLAGGAEDADYFDNWARVRRVGLAHDVPTWVFIQTLAYANHREPTAAELAWQVNVSLAYGAKGIQYFTYWTPDPARGEGFEPALVTVDGELTPRYDAARDLNTRWLRQVGKQLKPLRPETVGHANETPLPNGTEAWQPDTWVRAVTGDPVLVSRFSSGDAGDPTQWLFLANRSHGARARVAVDLAAQHVEEAQRFDARTERYRPGRRKRKIEATLEPGGAELHRLVLK